MHKFKVNEAQNGLRADVFVADNYPEHSRSTVGKLFEVGLVSLDGEDLKAGEKVKTGQTVTVEDAKLHEKPPKIDLLVIYEDENVIVIDKPAGILTHSKGGFNNEATVATFIAPKLEKGMEGNRAGIVHRLDRATSGVIICAKTKAAQKFLQKQFAQRRTKKTYLAIVEGKIDKPELIIDAPIARNPKKPQTFMADAQGKPAQTEIRVLKILNKSSISQTMVELKPATGRTHQLRVHLKYINHSIVGDALYGKASEHMLLHAKSLELTLPGGERKVFEAKIPEYFNAHA